MPRLASILPGCRARRRMRGSAQCAAAALADLAPTGKLRAAINFGNPVLASRDPASGQPRGVSVELSRALAARPGVEVEFALFESAGRVVDAARSDMWDVAYVAIDPARAQDTLQSPASVIIEGAFLARAELPIRHNDDAARARR